MSVLQDEGRRIVEALGGQWTPQGGVCRCPAHDDRLPSLSIRPGIRRLLVHCFAGCPAKDVLSALRRGSHRVQAWSTDEHATHEKSGNRRNVERLWGQATAVELTPALEYLKRRSIAGVLHDDTELRFLRRTPLGPAPRAQYLPALLVAVREGPTLVAMQRVFISDAGEPLPGIHPFKRMLGQPRLGAVRLGRVDKILGLAEGFETALSATALFSVPCWATLGTERFDRLAIPTSVDRLILFLDNDRGGQRAAQLAYDAFGNRIEIETRMPRDAGADWNDVLCGRAC